MLKKLSLILFITGIILILINIAGLFVNLRNDDIYKEKFSNHFGIELTENQFYDALEKILSADDSDSLKAVSVSLLVNKSLAHYWNRDLRKYNIAIPFYENYLLFLDSYINPSVNKRGIKRQYEFLNWKKAIERGVGLCSQHAIITSEILNENGIKSCIIGLNGHVVASARLSNGKLLILDPDYGVNIPHSLQEIERNPELIESYYAIAGYDTNRINVLKKLFDSEGNRVYENAKVYKGKSGRFETFSYLAIWILPFLFMIPYIIVSREKNNQLKKLKLLKSGSLTSYFLLFIRKKIRYVIVN